MRQQVAIAVVMTTMTVPTTILPEHQTTTLLGAGVESRGLQIIAEISNNIHRKLHLLLQQQAAVISTGMSIFLLTTIWKFHLEVRMSNLALKLLMETMLVHHESLLIIFLVCSDLNLVFNLSIVFKLVLK